MARKRRAEASPACCKKRCSRGAATFAACSLITSAFVACSSDKPSASPDASPASSAALSASVEMTSPAHPRARLDGRNFPDKVLALSWDDGPDASTFELAAYLAEHRISATFFVVGSWMDGLSDDPGRGKGVFQTGYEWVPILGDLVALGHRLGNHTLNHVVLRERVGEEVAYHELRDNQRVLDAFITNELRLFRAPGGGWGSFAENIVNRDAYLSGLVGPVFWDIDRKDWDESLDCTGSHAPTECEHHGPSGALRMKPSAVAARYLETIERARHGIVLLHDRVGDVGSRYALTIARALIPELEARGYVFSAPVLHFSPLTPRLAEGSERCTSFVAFSLGDLDGDGREDVCGRTSSAITCALSVRAPSSPTDRLARTTFQRAWEAPYPFDRFQVDESDKSNFFVADITGDAKADVCVEDRGELDCAVTRGMPGTFRRWSAPSPAHAPVVGLADVDGDGKADVCKRSAAGIECARSTGSYFDVPKLWLSASALEDVIDVALADVDGNGKVDLCAVLTTGGMACATSSGKSFGPLRPWSSSGDFAKATTQGSSVRFADLNGDKRTDVCAVTIDGFSCALSTGRSFVKATPWLSRDELIAQNWDLPERASTLQLGDINGDGRADVCGMGAEGMICGLAP